MNKKLTQIVSETLTNQEIWRIIDLANRRVIDNGEEFYSKREQLLFKKMREIMKKVPKGSRCAID